MTHSEGTSPHNPGKRWYDQDPVLARAIEQLRTAPDRYQAQVALNIIKIIVEHQIELETDLPVEDLDSALNYRRGMQADHRHRRWYDMHETLSSAMRLLEDCPDDLQRRVIPSIANMIENTLKA
ncbi:MAG TPA: hypothetical protein V6C99_04145 [Oculatellaceae cyanobacterium]